MNRRSLVSEPSLLSGLSSVNGLTQANLPCLCIKYAMKYCVFLKPNLKIKGKCAPLKILCNRCGPLCFKCSPSLT